MTAQFDEPTRRERDRAAGEMGVNGALPPVGYLDRWRGVEDSPTSPVTFFAESVVEGVE